MSLSCQRIQSRIALMVDGALDEPARREIIDHTDRCTTCGDELDRQRRMTTAVHTGPVRTPPPMYFEGVLAEIHRRAPLAPRRIRPPWRFRLSRPAMANVLVFGLAALWVFSLVGPRLAALPGTAPRRSSAAGHSPVAEPIRLVRLGEFGLVASTSPCLRMRPEDLRAEGWTEAARDCAIYQARVRLAAPPHHEAPPRDRRHPSKIGEPAPCDRQHTIQHGVT